MIVYIAILIKHFLAQRQCQSGHAENSMGCSSENPLVKPFMPYLQMSKIQPYIAIVIYRDMNYGCSAMSLEMAERLNILISRCVHACVLYVCGITPISLYVSMV